MTEADAKALTPDKVDSSTRTEREEGSTRSEKKAERAQRNAGKHAAGKRMAKGRPIKRSLTKRIFYFAVRLSSQFLGVFLFNLRSFGRDNIPGEGGALILCTHQSHFDPVLIGVTFNERLNYLARRTLFKNRIFGLIITLLDAIELDRDRSGLAGLKETMQRLKRGEKVLIFPEGTRTTTGQMSELKPGFLSVARRSKVQLVPVAIVGAYDALPKGSKVPLRHPLRLQVGRPIENSEIATLDEEATLQLVTNRLRECDQLARKSIR